MQKDTPTSGAERSTHLLQEKSLEKRRRGTKSSHKACCSREFGSSFGSKGL